MNRITVLILVSAAQSFLQPARAAEPTAAQIEFFEKKIRPIFVNHCYACHSADTKPASGLRVDDHDGFFRGGQSGPPVMPGDPDKSTLIKKVTLSDPKRRMPKDSEALASGEIEDLRTWIRDGAAWPVEKVALPATKSSVTYERLRAHHWSLQPVSHPAPPAVANQSWPRGDVDRFILAKLEARKLTPAADASRETLIRRVTYDLTGLPPSLAEVRAFARDRSPGALERLVDQLLASPQFGEAWGRHWLDVARYGESTGPSRNIPYPHAWRYRDYVIDAFNRDVPYNRFLREQIAGDLLPASSGAERDRLLVATGFLALGPKDVNQRFEERFLMDNVAEQIDTVTRSTLAYTVACARCHDHKFDPIPTADYYALAGIFASTQIDAGVRSKMGGAGLDYYDPDQLLRLSTYEPAPRDEAVTKLETDIAAAKTAWQAIADTKEGLTPGPDGRPRERQYRMQLHRLQAQLLETTDPGWRGYAVHGVTDAKEVSDTAIRVRGEAERKGPVSPRGFLTAFTVPGIPRIDPSHSGRLELAQWLTDPANPLTARVMVNRIWARLFGRGIVSTVDNFGTTGDTPTHPELLDYLASRFVEQGWSVKRFVRMLVLSRTYQLSSTAAAEQREIDPSNKLLWRHSPRRLEAEEIRDTILAASGQLDLKPPQGSPVREMKMVEFRDNGPEAAAILESANRSTARSIYLPALRGVTPPALAAFDPVTRTLVTGAREETTVPSQALYMLNSSFVRQQSLAIADGVLGSKGLSDRSRIVDTYWRVLGRGPSAAETSRAERYLSLYRDAAQSPGSAAPPSPVRNTVAPDFPMKFGVDTDDMDRAEYAPPEPVIESEDPRRSSWMSLAQALFASAEFRFVR